ncbi:class I SAM-dependent methyltransferase [Haliscomenobacter sp.]|uniref:class I SAM-dependent methyltransferase n=1 Tax=Haliscomenobacter sp. TaxID=2717303 RepID=UPI003593239E
MSIPSSSNPIAYDTYQTLATAYADRAPNKEYNAYYDRPAMLSLLEEDLAGQNILDAGCGPGIYSEILLKKGAEVTGIDVSENMVQHAQTRNGDQGRFIVGNLEEPLSMFQDQQFDGVLSALAISYVKDISALFGEFQRILKPGAWFCFSTEHPFFSYGYFKLEDYFETQSVFCQWRGFTDEPITMHSYYHSLSCITDALLNNGLVIERILEAKPVAEFEQKHPRAYAERLKFPSFIHFRARKA